MTGPLQIGNATLHLGDCRDVLPTLGANSVDAVVCDPPYELTSKRGATGTGGFMGKQWDATGIAFDPAVWAEVLRVLKPGGHLLSFGGSRTYHRMASAIEDAGFEIRDQIMWVFGSGYPKSHNLHGHWEGWGTALKPAHEPIVVARKTLVGTVAENVRQYGTGALNINGCRVPIDPTADASQLRTMNRGQRTEDSNGQVWGLSKNGGDAPQVVRPEGRWPANLIHDGSEEVRQCFPDAPGQQAAVTGNEPTANGFSGAVKYSGMIGWVASGAPRVEADRSAARFFYCPKVSRKEREEGCESLDKRPLNWSSGTENPGSFQSPGTEKAAKNHHPTVKPTELMQYLCRLVTPPSGTILDPFAGSGSTLKAALLEGFHCIGIEREPEYFEIAKARVALSEVVAAAGKEREAEPVNQFCLF